MKNLNQTRQQGITLIALVITIIVLLILAGVTIAMLTGNNGILTQAQNAKEENEIAEVKERAKLDIQDWVADKLEKGEESSITTPEKVQEILNEENPDSNNWYFKSLKDEGIETKSGYIIPYDEFYTEGNTPIDEETSYVGYYADFDTTDGKVDGIIYADLAVGGSGIWNDNSWSGYEYSAETEGLKSYYVSSESYTSFTDGTIEGWTKPVLTEIEGSGTKDRFYVMALEDFNPGTSYFWYNLAFGRLDNTISTSTKNFNLDQGKVNTTKMIEKWNGSGYGSQNEEDMWGVIQKADNEGKTWDLNKWFVPSKVEWSAFGDMANSKMGVTESNYSKYGLSGYYWSSSQNNTANAYDANFSNGYMGNNRVNSKYYVRLSATF